MCWRLAGLFGDAHEATYFRREWTACRRESNAGAVRAAMHRSTRSATARGGEERQTRADQRRPTFQASTMIPAMKRVIGICGRSGLALRAPSVTAINDAAASALRQ